MAGLTAQNFVLAAAGMGVAVAVVRGFARHEAKTLGGFWLDVTRAIILSSKWLIPKMNFCS
jgi:K+-transporting ATPase ATPase A chain